MFFKGSCLDMKRHLVTCKQRDRRVVAPKCASANTPSSQYFDFPDATTLCSGSYSSDLGSSLMEEERMLTYLANKKPQKATSKEKGKK